MAEKFRVYKSEADGRFYPMFKSGWFGRWNFFGPDAATTSHTLVIFIKEDDPAKAASFPSKEEAWTFIEKVGANATQNHVNANAARERAANFR